MIFRRELPISLTLQAYPYFELHFQAACANVRTRPIAEVSAFPERRMVFATPGWKGRLVPTGVFPPCMNLDSPF